MAGALRAGERRIGSSEWRRAGGCPAPEPSPVTFRLFAIRYSLFAFSPSYKQRGRPTAASGITRSARCGQQGAHQHRTGPHTRCLPGGHQRPQRPPQAAFWIGVKFCAAPCRLALPRQVCAWAPAAKPARRIVAAMAVDSLRMWSSVNVAPDGGASLAGCAGAGNRRFRSRRAIIPRRHPCDMPERGRHGRAKTTLRPR